MDLEKEVIAELLATDKNSINQDNTKEITFKYDNDYYANLVFNGGLNEVKNIKIAIEITHSRKENWHIWQFFRNKVSSMKITKIVGIQMYLLIKDSSTNKYLGIMCLGSEFNNIGAANEYIGWNKNTKLKNIKHILNIKVCVPLQPFGFNFTGGKLLTMLAFSREISEIFQKKMKNRLVDPKNYPILAISTTSLYGKGTQYRDLQKYIKLIGITKGMSTIHISDQLYEKCKKLCHEKNIDISRKKDYANSKFSVISRLLPHIGLGKTKIFMQNYKRGVYFGELYPNSMSLLRNYELTDNIAIESVNIKNLKTCDQLFEEWFHEYASKRYSSLKSRKKDKRKVNIYSDSKEIKRESVRQRRLEKIKELGLASLTSQDKINNEIIIKRGTEIIRKQEKERKKNSKSAYIKKKFNDKYDLNLFSEINFNKKNEHMKKYIPQIIKIIEKNQYSTIKDISEKIPNVSYSSLRTLIDKIKRDIPK